MATTLILDKNATGIHVGNPMDVYGSGGTESVLIDYTASGVVLDQNLERADFAGATSAYTFKQGGNALMVYSGSNLIATIPTQTDTDGTQLVFTNGSVQAKYVSGVMTLGGTTVTSTAAAVTPATIDTTVTSNASTGGTTTPSFSVSTDTSVTEGNSATFTVKLSTAQGTETTVDFALEATGGAVLGTDTGTAVPGTTGTLKFAPGETSKTVTVPVTFDSTVETGEGLKVTLSKASTGTALGTATAATTIADPTAPTFTIISNVTAGSATEEGATIVYTITPNTITDKAYTFTLNTEGAAVGAVTTLASSSDFSPASTTVTFAAGTTTAQTVTQTVVADSNTEGLEGYKTSLLDSAYTSIGSVTGVINDSTTPGGGGVTKALTVSGSTGSFDTITTGTGNDTFIAGPAALETGDILDGGSGTDKLYSQDAANGAAPVISNIEEIFIRNDMSANDTFSLADVTGVTTIWADRLTNANATLTLEGAGLTTATKIGITQGGSTTAADLNDVTFNFAGVTGSTDTATLLLDAANADNVTIAGIETLNIATSTGASKIDGTLTVAAAKNIVITGAQNLTIDATDFDAASGYTVDASAFTGTLNVALEDQAAGKTLTYTGGSGTDIVILGAGLDALDVIDGKGGVNYINSAVAADLTATTGAVLKNFQVFAVAGNAAGTYDMDFITGGGSASTITAVAVLADIAAACTVQDLLDTGSVTFNTSITSALTVTQKDAAAAGSSADSMTINVATAETTADITVAGITVADVETIKITSNEVSGKTAGHTITDMTFAAATQLVLTGNEQLTINGMTGSVALTNIDASAMTDKLIFGAAADMIPATILLVTGGLAADTLFLEENVQLAGSTIIGGGGADTITINDAAVNNKIMSLKYLAQTDSTGSSYDKITGFTNAAGADDDTINLAAFGFTGAQAQAFTTTNATVANATDTFTITTANSVGFFNNASANRAVACATDGTDSVVFVDANKDGNWDATTDMAIYLNLTGAVPVTADFVFA